MESTGLHLDRFNFMRWRPEMVDLHNEGCARRSQLRAAQPKCVRPDQRQMSDGA